MKIDKTINELLILLIAIIMTACMPVTAQEGSGQPNTEETTMETTVPTEGNDNTINIQPDKTALETQLLGTNWQLTSLNEITPTGEITLTFEEATVNGSDGCNGYGASYTVEGDTISFDTSGFMSTLMACEPVEIMQEGRAYLDMLPTATSYELTDGILTIQTERGALVFASADAEPATTDSNIDINGTSWILNAIITSDTSDEVSNTITATFENGQLGGSAGCNTYSTAYLINGTEMIIEAIATTRKMCQPAVNAEEQAFLEKMAQVGAFTASETLLTLQDVDGNPLLTFVRD